MKKAFFILLAICSCNSNELLDNNIEKFDIDNLKYSDCYLEVKRQNGSDKFDTVRHIYHKFDKAGNLRYKKVQYELDNEKYTNETYYTKDKIDFLTTTESDNFKEYTEVFFNNKSEIVELSGTEFYEDKHDTLRMFYKYSYYDSRNVKTQKMTSEDNLMCHIINYDKSKKAISEYTTFEQDTVERKEYIYFNDKVKRIEVLRTVGDSLSIIQYHNQSELNDSTILSKIINGKNITIQKMYFEYDKENNRVKSVVTKLPDNTTEITERIKKSCD